MQNLFDFIQTYTIGKESLDKQFSIELYNFLRSFYSVEDFVKSMEFMQNIYDPYFAYYLPSERQLYINFNKMANDINAYINSLNIYNRDKVLALYLCLFHLINHEFKHICQEKEKTNNQNTIESRLLTLSDWIEQYYREEGMLFSRYKIDPIERQAELSSLSQLISMTKSGGICALTTEMTRRYIRNAKEGYLGTLEDYPAKSFLKDYWYPTVNLIEELDEYPITQDNLQTRIELGLRITKDENERLKVYK